MVRVVKLSNNMLGKFVESLYLEIFEIAAECGPEQPALAELALSRGS